ncbi:MAG TPA: hypothetical protein VMD92_05515 [Acidobacteriaceae bacterium]|nr:hypothetical protein [Acidobacteriaceae bacterium]
MRVSGRKWMLLAAAYLPALAAAQQPQSTPVPTLVPLPALPAPVSSAPVAPLAPSPSPAVVPPDPAVQVLLGFQDSQVRFRLPDLMEILRDRRHEGWLLTAYPDPKTSRPLIGAGFSLDLPERPHPQLDPLNPHPFLEPSSAELWQAAGLDPQRLRTILDVYQSRLDVWGVRRFRRHIAGLDSEISDAEADSLLRIAVIQAIGNARAYCRNFDSLTAPQQMALTQLVYQMGVNLQEFDHFLALINNEPDPLLTATAAAVPAPPPADPDHWHAVQVALEHSQWARLYRSRAVAVIAMLDPRYADSPSLAERRIAATLRPAVAHRRRRHSAPRLRVASTSRPPRPRLRTSHASHGRRRV